MSWPGNLPESIPLSLREKNAAKGGHQSSARGPTWTNIGYLETLAAVKKTTPNYQIPLGPKPGGAGIALRFSGSNVGGESRRPGSRQRGRLRSASPQVARISADQRAFDGDDGGGNAGHRDRAREADRSPTLPRSASPNVTGGKPPLTFATSMATVAGRGESHRPTEAPAPR